EGVFGFSGVEIDVKSSGAAGAALGGIGGEGDVAQAGGAGRHVQPAPESAPANATVGGVLARATTTGALAPAGLVVLDGAVLQRQRTARPDTTTRSATARGAVVSALAPEGLVVVHGHAGQGQSALAVDGPALRRNPSAKRQAALQRQAAQRQRGP